MTFKYVMRPVTPAFDAEQMPVRKSTSPADMTMFEHDCALFFTWITDIGFQVKSFQSYSDPHAILIDLDDDEVRVDPGEWVIFSMPRHRKYYVETDEDFKRLFTTIADLSKEQEIDQDAFWKTVHGYELSKEN